MRVLVYAGNLRHGGAVGVATSLVDFLTRSTSRQHLDWLDSLHVVVSDRIAQECANPSAAPGLDLTIEPERGWWLRRWRGFNPAFDIAFTVFGPATLPRLGRIEVAGFADASLLVKPSGSHSRTRSVSQVRELAIWEFQRRLKLSRLRHYDHFIVESQYMRSRLVSVVHSTAIDVVPNAPSKLFEPGTQTTPTRPHPDSLRKQYDLLLFFPARGWPHKNHRVLALAHHELLQRYGRRVLFLTTLRQTELASLGLQSAPGLRTLGELTLRECANWMHACDGVVFPSLNETSSATPLEARASRKPLFASDRRFVFDQVGDYAHYFNPVDPADLARVIYQYFDTVGESVDLSSDVDRSEWTTDRRSRKYIEILEGLALRSEFLAHP